MGQWVVNWKKIQTVEDIKSILMAMAIHPVPENLGFEYIRHLCVFIDDDGKELPDPTQGDAEK